MFDRDRLRDSFGDLGPEALAFFASFLAAVPAMLSAIATPLAADDGPAARDAVHALKGAAHSIGAVRLGLVAGDVQNCLDAGDLETARLMAGLLEPTLDELVMATASMR